MTFRRIFTGAVKGYSHGVNVLFGPRFLFYTNVCLSIMISTLGDLLEQSYEIAMKEITKYDFHRTAHMSFSGGTSGVLCHHWYKFMDKVIKGRTIDQALKKLFLDQCIASPIIIMSFFVSVAIFEDNPWESFNDEVQDKFWTLYKAEWVVWPPAQMINFYFLPTRFRVIYDNTISLGYDVYTSHVKHAKSKTKKKKSEENNTNHNKEEQNDEQSSE